MKEIVVCNRSNAEKLQAPNVPHVWFSISTPNDAVARPQCNEHTLKVLSLQFYDADAVVTGQNSVTADGLFSPEQARQIIAVVKAYPEATTIMVHCDAGSSRSPGVAAAVAKIVNGDDSYFFNRYSNLNRRVYRLILDEYYSEV